jgi:hypothetical protein
MRPFILFIILSCCFISLSAQETSRKLVDSLKQLAGKHKQDQALRFDILYRYVSLSEPGKVLDSINGYCERSGENYLFGIDGTKTIHAGKLMIFMFEQDAIMYLAKPSTLPKNNPIALFDSLALALDKKDLRIENLTDEYVVTHNTPALAYSKSSSYHIDKKTGYITKAVAKVKSELLGDISGKQQEPSENDYVLIEIIYKNYRTSGVDPAHFQESTYVIRNGNSYQPTPEFKSYKIFIGSTNL